ncbi:MAG TPA: HEAT repeat domain-containing protein [Planctomycetota bacterium]|nr:HEAT repeat domain-containing protein [Planctomycetota bacterium]
MNAATTHSLEGFHDVADEVEFKGNRIDPTGPTLPQATRRRASGSGRPMLVTADGVLIFASDPQSMSDLTIVGTPTAFYGGGQFLRSTQSDVEGLEEFTVAHALMGQVPEVQIARSRVSKSLSYADRLVPSQRFSWLDTVGRFLSSVGIQRAAAAVQIRQRLHTADRPTKLALALISRAPQYRATDGADAVISVLTEVDTSILVELYDTLELTNNSADQWFILANAIARSTLQAERKLFLLQPLLHHEVPTIRAHIADALGLLASEHEGAKRFLEEFITEETNDAVRSIAQSALDNV